MNGVTNRKDENDANNGSNEHNSATWASQYIAILM
jgi:hypothetical protein